MKIGGKRERGEGGGRKRGGEGEGEGEGEGGRGKGEGGRGGERSGEREEGGGGRRKGEGVVSTKCEAHECSRPDRPSPKSSQRKVKNKDEKIKRRKKRVTQGGTQTRNLANGQPCSN